jgi:hypothetical protein
MSANAATTREAVGASMRHTFHVWLWPCTLRDSFVPVSCTQNWVGTRARSSKEHQCERTGNGGFGPVLGEDRACLVWLDLTILVVAVAQEQALLRHHGVRLLERAEVRTHGMFAEQRQRKRELSSRVGSAAADGVGQRVELAIRVWQHERPSVRSVGTPDLGTAAQAAAVEQPTAGAAALWPWAFIEGGQVVGLAGGGEGLAQAVVELAWPAQHVQAGS